MLLMLRVLLPVLWAIVSTLLGLLLYKTSAAFFERASSKDGVVQRVRLVGSIVIAGVIFLGIRQSTPLELLTGVDDDSQPVRKADILSLREAVKQAKAANLDVDACTTMGAQCGPQVTILRDRLQQIDDRIDQIAR